jgi:hypothetical protein
MRPARVVCGESRYPASAIPAGLDGRSCRLQHYHVAGATQLVQVQPDTWVANMIAQRGIRSGSSGPPIRYDAVADCLSTVAEHAARLTASVHMPHIGCGLCRRPVGPHRATRHRGPVGSRHRHHRLRPRLTRRHNTRYRTHCGKSVRRPEAAPGSSASTVAGAPSQRPDQLAPQLGVPEPVTEETGRLPIPAHSHRHDRASQSRSAPTKRNERKAADPRITCTERHA